MTFLQVRFTTYVKILNAYRQLVYNIEKDACAVFAGKSKDPIIESTLYYANNLECGCPYKVWKCTVLLIYYVFHFNCRVCCIFQISPFIPLRTQHIFHTFRSANGEWMHRCTLRIQETIQETTSSPCSGFTKWNLVNWIESSVLHWALSTHTPWFTMNALWQ